MKNLLIPLLMGILFSLDIYAQPQAIFEQERDSLELIRSGISAKLALINSRLDYLNGEIIQLKIDSIRMKGIEAYLKEPAFALDSPSEKNGEKVWDFDEGARVIVHGAKREFLLVNLDGIAGYIHSRHFLKTEEITFLLEVSGIREEPPTNNSTLTEPSSSKAPLNIQIQKNDATRCIAKTQDGTRCKNKTTNLSGKCHVHGGGGG